VHPPPNPKNWRKRRRRRMNVFSGELFSSPRERETAHEGRAKGVTYFSSSNDDAVAVEGGILQTSPVSILPRKVLICNSLQLEVGGLACSPFFRRITPRSHFISFANCRACSQGCQCSGGKKRHFPPSPGTPRGRTHRMMEKSPLYLPAETRSRDVERLEG